MGPVVVDNEGVGEEVELELERVIDTFSTNMTCLVLKNLEVRGSKHM